MTESMRSQWASRLATVVKGPLRTPANTKSFHMGTMEKPLGIPININSYSVLKLYLSDLSRVLIGMFAINCNRI